MKQEPCKDDNKKLAFVKNYIYPIVAFAVGVAIAWTTMQSSVAQSALAIDELKTKYDQVQDMQYTLSQQIAGINVNLEYIKKAIDKLNQ